MNIQETKVEYISGLPFEAKLYRAKKTEPHFHNSDLEIIYCISGSAWVDFAHEHILLSEDEIVTIDPTDIHYMYSDEENALLIMHLDLLNLRIPWEQLKYMLFACESSHIYPYQKQALNNVLDILLTLSYSFFRKGIVSNEDTISMTNRLITILIRYFNWFNYENQDDYMNPELHDRFYRVFAYCYEHYQEKISILQLASKEHISYSYFSQFIGNTVFKSFGQMVNYIRCYMAENKLLTTDMSNQEIAYSCGFSDPKYFYSGFRKHWGCTPGMRRKKMKSYMDGRYSSELISERESASILKNYITKWHIKKCITDDFGASGLL